MLWFDFFYGCINSSTYTYHISFAHSCVAALLGWLNFLVIVNSAVTNMGVQESVKTDLTSFQSIPTVVLLDHMVVLH